MLFKQQAFTLIELMLALAISALLIGLAYPTYISYQAHAERARAEVALMQLSAKLESYFEDNNSYEGASLKKLHAAHLTDGLDYQLKIIIASDNHYEIQAEPTGAQATRDVACGILSLTDANERKISGDGDVNKCWR